MAVKKTCRIPRLTLAATAIFKQRQFRHENSKVLGDCGHTLITQPSTGVTLTSRQIAPWQAKLRHRSIHGINFNRSETLIDNKTCISGRAMSKYE